MNDWIEIKKDQDPGIPPNALVLFYAPHARYVWATSDNLSDVIRDYGDVTHYKIVTEQPKPLNNPLV